MEIKGNVYQISEVQKGTSKAGKEWTRQNLVIDTGDEYNPHLSISFLGEKCSLLNNLKINDEVNVHINLSSKEWSGKWFTNVNGWKIDLVGVVESNEIDNAPF
jgi:hypothetical protein|tara:strand:+ start:534 stop:842 length:309 start_codon:yes stop_codon:yes gene_type:complete